MLPPLPQLDHHRGPHRQQDAIDGQVLIVQCHLLIILVLIPNIFELIAEENQPWDCRDDQLTCVEHQECKVKAHLLSIIVGDKVEGLHVVEVSAGEEGEEQLDSVLLETLNDLVAVLVVQREVV